MIVYYILIVICLVVHLSAFDEGRFIIGGTDEIIQNAPYQVSIVYSNSHTCGGSIISQFLILSAAHCFPRPNEETFYGICTNSTSNPCDYELYPIEQYIVHPAWNEETFDNDFSLIYIKGGLFIDDQFVKIIDLPDADDRLKAGDSVTITGWGVFKYVHTKSNKNKKLGAVANTLQSTQMNVISNIECMRKYKMANINRFKICIVSPDSTSGACSGDSGGPLILKPDDHAPILFGVASNVMMLENRTGLFCSTHYPNVYSSVVSVVPWLKRKIAYFNSKESADYDVIEPQNYEDYDPIVPADDDDGLIV